MKHYDYLIVGQGLAGTVLAFKLIQQGKNIFIIDKHRDYTSSKIAPGAYNPMVLKRFTPCWKVEEQLDPLKQFIDDFETSFQDKIHIPMPLWRKFQSVQEQNLWMEKSESARLKPFMEPRFISNPHQHIQADFGFGQVNNSGRVILPKMIQLFRDRMIKESLFLDEDFNPEDLELNNLVRYKDISADKIVFCEGHRMTLNPMFAHLPMLPTKGELITVRINDLKVEQHIKTGISLLPLGDDLYKVGATFNWVEKDEIPTEAAKVDLVNKLKALVDLDVELVNHQAGLRPAVKDRRALVGQHPEHSQVYVFNGLGSRGLLISPYLANQLIAHMEESIALNPEVDINRFAKEYTC
jgi:hypothetical protein